MKKLNTTLIMGFILTMLAMIVYAASSTVTVNLASSPATNTWHATRSPAIYFNVSGNSTQYKCYLYSNDTHTWTRHNTEYLVSNYSKVLIADANFNEGDAIIWNVRCNDTTNNIQNFSGSNRTIKIDVTKPSVTLNGGNSPSVLESDNFYTNNLTFFVNFTAIETNPEECSLYINDVKNSTAVYKGSGYRNLSATTSVNGTSLTYYVSCNDSAKNTVDSIKRTVHVGYSPTITINSPANKNYSNTTNAIFNLTVTGHSSDYTCYIYSNVTGNYSQVGAFSTIQNNTATAIKRRHDEKDISWNAVCYEKGTRYPYVSSSFGSNYTLFVDATSPSVTLLGPSDNAYTNSAKVYINLTDAHPSQCYLTINGSRNTTNTSVISTDFHIPFSASDGSYIWNVTCNDTAKNLYTTATRRVTLDTVYPNIRSTLNFSYGNCEAFKVQHNFSEAVNFTMGFDLASGTKALWGNDSNTAFASYQNMTIIFGKNYETTFYYNYTFCDRAGNCNASVSEKTITSPVGLCSGWTLWSLYDGDINFSDIYEQSNAEYVYWWNRTGQSWLYYSSASTTYGANDLGYDYGDTVFLYSTAGTTWWRNMTGAGKHIYSVNITSGDNFLALYYNYSFGNLSYHQFTNKTDGNRTLQNYPFKISYFASYNNTGQTYNSFIYQWNWNNLTPLGNIKNGLDTLWLYSAYNITLNMTRQGHGYVYGNWS